MGKPDKTMNNDVSSKMFIMGKLDETMNNDVSSDETSSVEGAAAGTPAAEDTPPIDAYKRLYEAQSAIVSDLTEQVISLQGQIAKLINTGAQVTDGRHEEPPAAPGALPKDYTPLDQLDFITRDARA